MNNLEKLYKEKEQINKNIERIEQENEEFAIKYNKCPWCNSDLHKSQHIYDIYLECLNLDCMKKNDLFSVCIKQG